MTETKLIEAFNPYNDSYQECICVMDMHNAKSGEMIHITTDVGIDLMDYLNGEKIEEVEIKFLEDL